MKYLWLAFLIGWSGSTYAAVGTSPSVDVPITISSSGPTPPAGAVAAGFTTLAANYDFTGADFHMIESELPRTSQNLPPGVVNAAQCGPGSSGSPAL